MHLLHLTLINLVKDHLPHCITPTRQPELAFIAFRRQSLEDYFSVMLLLYERTMPLGCCLSDAQDTAINNADAAHKEHRLLLKQEIGRMLLFFSDQPTLLAPNLQVHMTLRFFKCCINGSFELFKYLCPGRNHSTCMMMSDICIRVSKSELVLK